jgi:hypothetical protein
MEKIFLILIICFACINASAQDSTLNPKQKELFQKLKNFRKPNEEFPLFDYSYKDYEHPLIAKQVIKLLSPEWTEEELDLEAKRYSISECKDLDMRAKDILKKMPKLSYKQIYDSLILREINHNKEELIKKGVGINSQTIKMAGYLYLNDAIPILKEGLTKPRQYNKSSLELALARMKVEPYYTSIMQQYDPNIMLDKYFASLETYYKEQQLKNIKTPKKWKKIYTEFWGESINTYTYISTPEAINKIEKWLYIDGIYIDVVSGYTDEIEIPLINCVVRTLFIYIQKGTAEYEDYHTKNYQRIVNNKIVTDKDTQFFRDYIKDNKYNLKLDKYWR